MGLEDLSWRGYYPGSANLLEEAVIPALRESTRYDRVTGSFSSAILSLLAAGLRDFLNQGGTIRLLVGLELFKEDIEAIRRGEEGDVVANQIDWEALDKGEENEVREALAWLIDQGHLEVKFGTVTDSDGVPRSSEYGEWHQKMAIFTDSDGQSVSFVGSPNESFKAMRRNRESVEATRSWVSMPSEDWDEAQRVREHRSEFRSLWENSADGAAVLDLPAAAEQELLRPLEEGTPDWDEVQSVALGEDRVRANKPDPWEHQEAAIERLMQNHGRLIIKHATGTGKTWTSLFAIQRFAGADDVVVVLAPTTDLVKQWAGDDNIGAFFPEARMVECRGGLDWEKRLHTVLNSVHDSPVFVISTMHPSTMGTMLDLVASSSEPEKRLLIVDEVHNIGAPMRREALEGFDAKGARIGLSATPERGDKGDAFIEKYFGSTIDEVTIEDAIEDLEVLSPYEYQFHIVTLSPGERDDYLELTEEIRDLYHTHRHSEAEGLLLVADRNSGLRAKIMERAAILKECAEKTDVAEVVIDDVGDRTLVFCNTKDHARSVRDRLTEASPRTFGLFLGEHSNKKRDQFLAYFEAGNLDTLVSIDCLTEGMDVPACDSAIIMANSTSEREAVQRRGRVLRKSEAANTAVIHDFLVLPVPREDIEEERAELTQAEFNLIQKELNRVEMMNGPAENAFLNNTEVLSLRSKLGTLQHDSN